MTFHRLDEHAFTLLEWAILAAFFLIAAYAVHAMFFCAGSDRPGGLVVSAVGETGGELMVKGGVTGFSAESGNFGGIDLVCNNPDPDKLGSVMLTVSLFVGDMGAIDMDRVSIRFAGKDYTDTIPETTGKQLLSPNWTISDKYNMVPLHEADDDNILEPNEQFELIIYPDRRLSPYETFEVIIKPEKGVPLPVKRTVPARVTKVMNLG